MSRAFQILAATTVTLASLAGCVPLKTAGDAMGGSPAETVIETEKLAKLESDLSACETSYQQFTADAQALRESIESLQTDVKTLAAGVDGDRAERLAALAALSAPADDVACGELAEPGKLIVGRRERVWVEELQLALPARIDTGAETASLDARNITFFERDGNPWVRFEIARPDTEDKIVLERKKIRDALILQASSEQAERRPVIELGIRLGDVRQLAEFTLSDRSHLDYQMLVGRNILRDVMLVDVSGVNLVSTPQQDRQPR